MSEFVINGKPGKALRDRARLVNASSASGWATVRPNRRCDAGVAGAQGAVTVATGSIVRLTGARAASGVRCRPLHVQWANVAASTWALPLGMIGGLLLAVRALDAVVDPWLRPWIDRCLRRSAPGWSPPSQRHWWLVSHFVLQPAVVCSRANRPDHCLGRCSAGLTLPLATALRRSCIKRGGARWGATQRSARAIVAGRKRLHWSAWCRHGAARSDGLAGLERTACRAGGDSLVMLRGVRTPASAPQRLPATQLADGCVICPPARSRHWRLPTFAS